MQRGTITTVAGTTYEWVFYPSGSVRVKTPTRVIIGNKRRVAKLLPLEVQLAMSIHESS